MPTHEEDPVDTAAAPLAGFGPEPVVVDRTTGATGGELVLRRAGEHFEIISNGVFLMDTRDGASEREMVRACLAALPEAADRAGPDVRVLIGGLGVGFSAREALDDARVEHVRVVELEPSVVDWHRGPLGAAAGEPLADPRCEVVCADLVAWLAEAAEAASRGGPWADAVCLDTDNGPDWTVVEGNGRLYTADTLAKLRRLLRPGGVAAFWSAMRAPAFAELLAREFGAVETVEVPARAGEPDIIYLVRTGTGPAAG
ncbi:spermidine synthase [Streptomonospora sp. PA3]|uniref:spermine/spermidine synthase domain-containing protein n=1 Tax=Streptomonospora sp. PA3 TaxID=2607326 RepID=UPI0012DDDB54|nr:spermidine synthase [Streptomonospora sp. PA3]MUL40456.1 spermidine synthase [Streptomonospora sp. PA3]